MIRLPLLSVGLCVLAVKASAQTDSVLSLKEVQQLEAKVAQNQGDRESQKLLGKNYAFFILGITSLKGYGIVDGVDAAKAGSAFAAHAASTLRSSDNPAVAGEGGYALWNLGIQVESFERVNQGQTAPTLDGERLLGAQSVDRAIALEPAESKWRGYRVGILSARTKFTGSLSVGAAEAYSTIKQDVAAVQGADRAAMLASVAKLAVEAKALDEAQAYAQELLESAHLGGWNAGNAVFMGNMVLGQVALRRGDKQAAQARLLAAGKTHGSPQLDSFGPNMTLAKELLETGDRETVVAYLELCRSFWKMEHGQLDQWIAEVKAGGTPKFGANLFY